MIAWLTEAASKKRHRALQMLALSVPLLMASLLTVGGNQWLFDIMTRGGMAVFACGLFYSVYRATTYQRIHEIAEEDVERGDRYRNTMLICYAIVFAACFM